MHPSGYATAKWYYVPFEVDCMASLLTERCFQLTLKGAHTELLCQCDTGAPLHGAGVVSGARPFLEEGRRSGKTL